MFNPAAFENSRPGGFGVMEVVGGPAEGGEQRLFVPLRRSELQGEVIGPLAALRLVQTFQYASEESSLVLEALYRFPLPGDAAVSGVRVRFGEVEIRAELKERQQAEESYQEARSQGQQAALLSRESPDVFTLQVAGLQPDQPVIVETAYVQLARPEGAGWSLRIPLTTAPRYVRSDEVDTRYAAGQPLLLMRDPGHRFVLDITLQGAHAVRSTTHQLEVSRQGSRLRAQLADGEVVPDRDCVLIWRPEQQQDRAQLEVLHYEDRDTGQVYFLALVAPPAVLDMGQGIPREVILLVDRSGSMGGAKWEASDWAVKQFLTGLNEHDLFNLGLFHTTTRWFQQSPQQARAGTVENAISFLEQHRDSGGTELGVALEQSLSQPRPAGDLARHVLIVTDAEVTDAGRVLRLADSERAEQARRRISVLCIDAAPNAFLVHQLTERGGGVARFLTSAPSEEDITTALDEVLVEWGEPALAGLRLEVSRPVVDAAGRESLPAQQEGWSAIDLGDLPAGRTIWVAGKVPRGESAELAFNLVAGKSSLAAQQVSLDEDSAERPALKTLYGARQVLGLEFLIHSGYATNELGDGLRRLGYDPDAVIAGQQPAPKIYAENTRADASQALRRLLVNESLNYGLASSETAFVAVRSEDGRPVEDTIAVANALPTGWSKNFLSGSSTHAGIAFAAAPAMPVSPSPLSMTGAPNPQAPQSYMPPGPPPMASAQAPGSGLLKRVGSFLRGATSADAGPPAMQEEAPGRYSMPPGNALYSGTPTFVDAEALLFDSEQTSEPQIPDGVRLSALWLRFGDGQPEQPLDPGLVLLLFVGDLAAPRAKVRLADLLRQGGKRPLNLARPAGQPVRIVLQDASGAWQQPLPFELGLEWR